MKRIRLLLTLCLLTALLPLRLLAGDQFSYTYQGTTLNYEVIDFLGKTCQLIKSNQNCSGDIVLPEHPKFAGKEYTLTKITDYAFSGNQKITSISIPNSVTEITDYAFNRCSGLTELKLPDGLTSIGQSAFYGCSGLKQLELPNSLTYLGGSAFKECTSLTQVYFSDRLVHIAGSAFYGCTSLTEVTLPKGLLELRGSAFFGCTNLTKVELPEGLTHLGNDTFNGCTALIQVNLPQSLTFIGQQAFYNCTALTGELNLPPGLTSIQKNTFYGCKNLTGNLIIPEGVTSIDLEAFRDCSGLNGYLVIPEGVTSIGGRAFQGCSGLTGDLVIPEGVTSIEDAAFYRCSGFNESLTLPSTLQKIGNNAFGFCSFTDAYLNNESPYLISNPPSATRYHIPPRTYRSVMESNWYNSYKSKVIREPFTDPIDGLMYQWAAESGYDVKVIGLDPAVESLTLPISVPAQIYGCDIVATNYSLQDCPNLTHITFDIENVPDNACAGLTKLKSVEFTENVKNIGTNLFAGLELDHITFGNENIPDNFSNGMAGLRSVEFTENVKSIGAHAFAGLPLESVTPLGTVPPTLGEDAFDKSENPIEIYLDDTLFAAYSEDEAWNDTFNLLGYSGTTPEGMGYDILSMDDKNMTVRLTKLSAAGATELVIPATINVNGRTAAVTELGIESASDASACTSLRFEDSDLPLTLLSNPLSAINNTKIRTVN
ncbi:MAG: leucine-rich repeat domain-containing protein, partial [Duncaniella sp.]|nr:leucine-rich repeat domain-containing protein [Duncaniella sp.]